MISNVDKAHHAKRGTGLTKDSRLRLEYAQT